VFITPYLPAKLGNLDKLVGYSLWGSSKCSYLYISEEEDFDSELEIK